MQKLLVAAACLILLQSAPRAEEPAAITAAKKTFYAERDKAETTLIAALERREATAKQAGDIKTIEAVRAEIEAFRNDGKLPKSVPTTTYENAMKFALNKLEPVFTAAIKSATKADNLEEAKELQKQLEEFRGKAVQEKAPADPFQPNSVWIGVDNGGESSRMTVKKRDKETFVAEIVGIKNNDQKIVTGSITDGKISWLAKDVNVIKGKPGGNNEGTIAQETTGIVINMTWRGTMGGGSGKYQYRLAK